MPRTPLRTPQDRTTVIQPGEEGIIIRSDGKIDILLPKGANARQLTERHMALAVSAYQCVHDDKFRAKQLQVAELNDMPIQGVG